MSDNMVESFIEDVRRGVYSPDGDAAAVMLREDLTALLEAHKCPQCGARRPYKQMRERRITQIRSGRAVTELMLFCSGTCGEHYQMGCEG
jgi:hypothetical protein